MTRVIRRQRQRRRTQGRRRTRAQSRARPRKGRDCALTLAREADSRNGERCRVSAGFYESATCKKFARVQLFTIEALLVGTARAEHPDYEPDLNFKKAKLEATANKLRFFRW